MAFQAPSLGVAAQLGMSASGTATEAYEFLNENLSLQREHRRNEGMRGTRLHPIERVRRGRRTPGGSISLQPTYAELANLLPRVVGAAQAGAGFNTYTVSDTQPAAYDVTVDRVAKVFSYTSCRTSRATFRGQSGGVLDLSLEVEALDESVGNAGTFPALTISATPPFIFEDGSITIGGTTYQMFDFECTLDWHLKTDRFVNSLTRTDLPSTDLTVQTKITVPYTSDTVALYDTDPASPTSAVVTFAYLGAGAGASGVSLKFTLSGLAFPANKNPVVANKDELTLTLACEARKSGSTAPLAVQLDSTP